MIQRSRTRKKSRSPLLPFLCLCLSLLSSLAAQERFRRTTPDPDPLPTLNLPAIQTHTFANELKLTVVQLEEAPVMYLRLIIDSGEISSPQDLPGLASLTANLIDKGASNLNSTQIEEILESIGGNFSSTVFPDYTVFSLSFLEEHLDEALDILSKMILEPNFLKLEVDNVKRTMRYELLQKIEDPEFLAKRLFFKILFENHTGQNFTFTDDVIKNLSAEASMSFFDEHYRPNNANIVLIGNINLQTASRKVSHYFNEWKIKGLNEAFIAPPQPNDKTRICFVNIPGIDNATVVLGNIITQEIETLRFPLLVFNQVLGGTANSRLFMNLRETKEYAFWAFSELDIFKAFGVLTVRAMVQPEWLYSSVTEIIREIQKASQEKIANNDIEQAKSYLINHFPLTIKNLDLFAQRVSEKEAFGLKEGYWNKYYENIMLVNPDDVFRAVQNRSLLAPLVVIIGDFDNLQQALNEFDEIEYFDSYGKFQYTIKKGDRE